MLSVCSEFCKDILTSCSESDCKDMYPRIMVLEGSTNYGTGTKEKYHPLLKRLFSQGHVDLLWNFVDGCS